MNPSPVEAVVIGVSAGGLNALSTLLPTIPATCTIPILVVQHRAPIDDPFLAQHLDSLCSLKVREACMDESLHGGGIVIAPANYHLLVENRGCLALNIDPQVNYSRPSIDVLFESAADVFGSGLVAVILTGANSDGSAGARRVKQRGGRVIAQDPASAESPFMPQAAIDAGVVDTVMPLEKIGPTIVQWCLKETP